MHDTAEIEFLLGRRTLPVSPSPAGDLLRGRRVLVTGAGGSIGGEIARASAALGCAQLALVDNHAGALFAIDRAIAAAHPLLPRAEVLCDVRDRARIGDVIAAQRPELVFHAAAIKHVNLVERHVSEGALTNLIGARNVAEAVNRLGAAMTLISTDKAACPTSRMGQTKRMAERVIAEADLAGPGRFAAVRFGNVFGSSGSVVEIFREQIRAGGPVTLTDPAMERYFMTAAEAVRLVFAATALRLERASPRCSVYVLEMGACVRIEDLARRMIARFASDPSAIDIVVTGPRPGERSNERLLGDDEALIGETATAHVSEVAARAAPAPWPEGLLAAIEGAARAGDDAAVRQLLDAGCVGARPGEAVRRIA